MSNSKKPRGRALLSVHDVAPLNAPEVKDILADLRERSIPAVNLAVIPFFHAKDRWSDDTIIRPAIQALPGKIRTEILLHGYYHDRVGSNETLPWRSRLRSRLQSASEDEFFRLDPEEAKTRIEHGRAALAESFGAAPTGFIPPGWGMTRNLIEVCRRSGLSTTEDQFFVFNARTGEKTFSPLIAFATRNALRENLALAWARLVPMLAGPRRLMRLVLHPTDYRSRKTRKQALETIERLNGDYDWCLYREIFLQQSGLA